MEDDTHKCSICERVFRTLSGLISHRRSAHVEENMQRVIDAALSEPAPGEERISPELLRFADEIHTTVTTNTPPKVRLRKLAHYGDLPHIARATPGSAAYDLFAAIAEPWCLRTQDRLAVPTGLEIELPPNMVAKICPRSGLAITNGISLLNAPGIIDSDYRGEIMVIMVNHAATKFWVQPGMRIAQMLIEPVAQIELEYVDELSDTTRGGNGFGSTGS